MRISYLTESVGVRLFFLILTDILVFLLGIALSHLDNQYILFKIAVFLILGILAYVTFKNSLSFIKGMDGESDVWKILRRLPPGYNFLHDFVEGKRGNIDYIVVGPTGVWTIEVKNYKERNADNQYLEKHLNQAREEAIAISHKFSLPVNPILVFTNPKTIIHFGLQKQEGVFVIGKSWLLDLVQNKSYGPPLSPAECERIYIQLKKNVSVM